MRMTSRRYISVNTPRVMPCSSEAPVPVPEIRWIRLKHKPVNTHLLCKGKYHCRYGWPPILFVCLQLLCLGWINNKFTCLVKSNPVKQEVSCTVILRLTKISILCTNNVTMVKATMQSVDWICKQSTGSLKDNTYTFKSAWVLSPLGHIL